MITVEECRKFIGNRFKLVILAAQRGYDLVAGAQPLLPRGDDKNCVLALREIATGLLDPNVLMGAAVRRCRKKIREEYVFDDHLSGSVVRENISLVSEHENKSGNAYSALNDLFAPKQQDEDIDSLIGEEMAVVGDFDVESDDIEDDIGEDIEERDLE